MRMTGRPPPPPSRDDPFQKDPDVGRPWRWWREDTTHGDRFLAFVMGWFLTLAVAAALTALVAVIGFGLWRVHPLILPATVAVVGYIGLLIYRITKP